MRAALAQPNEADRVLDISGQTIDFDFDLDKYLKALQPDYPEQIKWVKQGDFLHGRIRHNLRVIVSETEFTGKANFRGITFEATADFQNATFRDNTYFAKTIFKSPAYFDNATFEGEADFGRSRFECGVYFKHTSFINKVDFAYSEFIGEPNFIGAIFHSLTKFYRAEFISKPLFDDVEFKNVVTFKRALFINDSSFFGTTFLQKAWFHHVEFRDLTQFTNTVFEDEVDFTSSTFGGKVWFSGSQFKDKTHFENTTFTREAAFNFAVFHNKPCIFRNITLKSESKIDFTCLSFEGDGHLRIENINFREESYLTFYKITTSDDKPRILIRDDTLNEADGQPESITFTDCSFSPNNVQVQQLHTQRLKVQGGNGLVGFNFSHCLWPQQSVLGWLGKGLTLRVHPNHPDDPNANPQAQKLLYERLKQQAQTDGDHQLAGEFYFWQQWFKWLIPKQHLLDWWVQTLYLAASAFGLSVMRPLLWLVVVMGVATTVLGCFDGQGWGWPSVGMGFKAATHVLPGLSTQGLSWAYDTNPKLQLPASGLVLWVSLYYLYVVTIGFLLFQLGAAIRGKVKR
jgi:uncharacterized protein YjbI with pentapeptide repeats